MTVDESSNAPLKTNDNQGGLTKLSEELNSVTSEPKDLRKLAGELNDMREQGIPPSGPEPAPKEAETPEPTARRWDSEARADGREPPTIKFSEKPDIEIDRRDAAAALAATRNVERQEARVQSEGDETLRRALGEWNAEQGRDPSQPMTPDDALRWAEQIQNRLPNFSMPEKG